MTRHLPLLAALAMLPLSSCLCLDLLALLDGPFELPDIPDAGPAEVPEGAVVVSEDEIEWISACASAAPEDTEPPFAAANAAFAELADGTVEVELSEDGCLFFSRTIADGRLQAARFWRFTGETGLVVDGGEIVWYAHTHTEAEWSRDSAGVLRGLIHDATEVPAPGDGEPPYEIETLEDPVNRTRQVTRFAANGDVVERLTITHGAAGTVQTIERHDDGVVTTETTHVEAEHRSQNAACNEPAVTCDDEKAAALDAILEESLRRARTCMQKLDRGRDDTWMRYVILQHRWSQAHSWGCLPAGCGFARWCATCQDSGDGLTIDVDYDAFMTYAAGSPERGQSTLFHEMLHGVLGYHSDIIVNSSIYNESTRRDQLMRRYTDRVNACEAYCFAPPGVTPTRCSCAACLETRVCDDRCRGLEGCGEVQNGTFIMSEAVGTACVNFDGSLGTAGEEKATWFNQKSDCVDSSCEEDGGRCDSKSLSCTPGCE